MQIRFSKYSATGNDFIVIDNRDRRLDARDQVSFWRQICRRRVSVGADGVILLQASTRADFEYVHINPDGSLAEMCGNGSRAITHFAYESGIVAAETSFEINGALYHASVRGNRVTTQFIPPEQPIFDLALPTPSGLTPGGFIVVGVPHLVWFTETELAHLDVDQIGRQFVAHPAYPTRGSNVNFIRILNAHTIQIRTFERGVNAETLACGTGSVASAIISHLVRSVQPPVTVLAPGGELTVDFTKDWQQPTLTGAVHRVFNGTLSFVAQPSNENANK